MTGHRLARDLRSALTSGRARLDAARVAFADALPGLLEQHAGRWVVFADGRVHHAESTRKAAHAWGMQHLGPLAGFLVEKVEAPK